MRIFNLVNIDYGKDRLKEFCINNFNAISSSIKSIVSEVRTNTDTIKTMFPITNGIKNGDYTPTLQSSLGMDSVIPNASYWLLSSNHVNVTGLIQVDPTSAALGIFDLDLPNVPGVTTINDLNGTFATDQGSVGVISLVGGNAYFVSTYNTNATEFVRYNYTYIIS